MSLSIVLITNGPVAYSMSKCFIYFEPTRGLPEVSFLSIIILDICLIL